MNYGCKVADQIIAISRQTKSDLIEFLNINENKIEVVYQSCNTSFYDNVGREEREVIRKKYDFPKEFILYVGTIEKRKNLLSIVRAINEYNIDMPLVAIGRPGDHIKEVKAYIDKHNMTERVIIDHNVETADLPAIYQMSVLFVYPSVFEGFGIPIIEALNSKTPVISSKGGCFQEAGGPDSIYIDPDNTEELANEIKKVLSDNTLQERMIINGYEFVQKFRDENIANNLAEVYETCIKR